MTISAVYDTMVLLQGAARPGHATMQALRARQISLFMSHALLNEVTDVLNREAVRAKFPALTPESILAFTRELAELSVLLDPVPARLHWIEHPDDDHLLNLTIATQASHLVTWESRILALAHADSPTGILLRQLTPNLAIVTPAQLSQILRAAPPQPT